MSTRSMPFALQEWFHCYNRGVEKRTVFENDFDYQRFLKLLYLTNSTKSIHLSDLHSRSLPEILQIPRDEPLAAIGAFCLMPNHYHLLLKEIREGGISLFMQKLATAYTMYFNIKGKRTGGLFAGTFKSRHTRDDLYFQRVIRYIHCNPAELYESDWKYGKIKNIQKLRKQLLDYPYSSFACHTDQSHINRIILDESVFDATVPANPQEMLREAAAYYEEINVKVKP